jgi:CO/xanthine dehydrogenase Mo-binding subunit
VALKNEAGPAKAVNIAQQSRVHRGDAAKGFAESDLVLEKTYRVPMVHQGYLEAHAVLAEWDRNGLLTLWVSTQGSFNTRSEVAGRAGAQGESDPRHSHGVRRRLRGQDPRPVRAHHRGAVPG